MSLYVGFTEYVAGQDPLGDAIARMAEKRLPELREKYPYQHCYLVCGHPAIGFHRAEMFSSGLSYVWYPAGGENFQKGIIFQFDNPDMELQAIYRILDPWTRNCTKTSKRQLIRMFHGEIMVWPDIMKGEFTCTTFVLWTLGLLGLPHRSVELIEALRARADLFREYQVNDSSEETPQSIRWVPES